LYFFVLFLFPLRNIAHGGLRFAVPRAASRPQVVIVIGLSFSGDAAAVPFQAVSRSRFAS
jgi:hypothetical protein